MPRLYSVTPVQGRLNLSLVKLSFLSYNEFSFYATWEDNEDLKALFILLLNQ